MATTEGPDRADAYFGRSRPEMLKFVPVDARKILDVGCGAGAFAAQLLRDGSEVWGIELDPAMASVARTRLSRVLQGSIEAALPSLPAHHFDCIVFNDVLEHLVDPFQVLRDMRPLLAPGGRVVASIPNVRYFYNVRELLLERQWRYRGYGILDRTHLRFFTALSMVDLFQQSGYEMLAQEGINAFDSWKFRLLERLTRGHVSDMRYEQFACVARPRAAG